MYRWCLTSYECHAASRECRVPRGMRRRTTQTTNAIFVVVVHWQTLAVATAEPGRHGTVAGCVWLLLAEKMRMKTETKRWQYKAADASDAGALRVV